ncbi:MAG: RecX family transcriptional regulator [Bacilli bacterium]|nr:RecX family transcriptional regulator [Bacilli bacterium]
MPLKSSGNTIKKIKVNKKDVVISFDKHESIRVVNEVMANFYLYPGKAISKKEIKEIEEFSSNAVYMKYALSLLQKGHYSEWKMREKLYAKGADKPSADKIIALLKRNDLIDDKAFALDLYYYLQEKHYGKNKIINYIKDKGIFEESMKHLKFNDADEKKKALINLPKLEKKYDKFSYQQKKEHIYNALIGLGFDSDIALSALNKIKEPNPKEEGKKLERDFSSAFNKFKRKYEGKELKEKVYASLRNKGYKSNDILRKWEEYYAENDF